MAPTPVPPAQAVPADSFAPPLGSMLDAVGQTPLLRLARFQEPGAAAIWLKLENLNPGGSVKDRICLAMITAAERSGQLRPESTVVEPTSGNTGIGLAMVCAAKGYRLVLAMPDNMSFERRALLKAYGAELVLTPAAQLMEGAIAKARVIAAETQNSFMPQQFENPANPAAHFETTGPEIAEAFAAQGLAPTALVAGVGTGGTLTGVGRALRLSYPRLTIVAVEPASCAVLSGCPPGVTRIQGLGAGFVPPILDRSLIDRIAVVRDEDAWQTQRELALREGVLAGISTGANLWAARQLARELGPKAHLVTFACDTGERYFSLQAEFGP